MGAGIDDDLLRQLMGLQGPGVSRESFGGLGGLVTGGGAIPLPGLPDASAAGGAAAGGLGAAGGLAALAGPVGIAAAVAGPIIQGILGASQAKSARREKEKDRQSAERRTATGAASGNASALNQIAALLSRGGGRAF